MLHCAVAVKLQTTVKCLAYFCPVQILGDILRIHTAGIAISLSRSASFWLTKSWKSITSGDRATYSSLFDWYGTDWLCCSVQNPCLSTLRSDTGGSFWCHTTNTESRFRVCDVAYTSFLHWNYKFPPTAGSSRIDQTKKFKTRVSCSLRSKYPRPYFGRNSPEM